MDSAPVEYNNAEASCWAHGYNTALEKTNAPQLLDALIKVIKERKKQDRLHRPIISHELEREISSLIKKATEN